MSTSTPESIEEPVEFGSPEFIADPHPRHDWLRRHAPVYRTRMPYLRDVDVYLLSRYDDCVAVATDPRFRRVVEGTPELPVPKAVRFLTTETMIMKDDPAHKRLRKLVSRPFTPRAISRLADRVQAVTDELLGEFSAGQEIDLLQEYALPIPVTVINEMVGVPDADRARFHEWMHLLIEGVATYGIEEAASRLEHVVDYLRGLIDRRRADPGDDILTGLVQASDDGDSLSDDEVVAMVFLLVAGGYETTYNVIANGARALLEHPDQLAALRADPTLIDPAVEEILRYTGTIGGTKPNYATEEVVWHGVTIPRAAMVIPLLASANRDPDVFDEPDRFDITRTPNPHIAFSKGAHYCLGASLARTEIRIALANLVARFPDSRLAVDPAELQIVPLPFWNRLRSLPVLLG